MATNNIAKYITAFLGEYLPHERNVSPNTISAYRDSFVSFFSFLRDEQQLKVEKVTLSDINRDNVLEYLRWLVEKNGNSIATRNNRLAAIHSFVSYLQYDSIEYLDQWQRILAIRNLKKMHPTPVHYTKEGVKLLLAQPDYTNNRELRHVAILALMYDTGCRVQELADLTIESLQIQYTPFSIKVYGKGRKVRIVPISEHVVEILMKYMDRYNIDCGINMKRPIFWNSAGKKLTRAGITYILKKYADMARAHNPHLIPDVTSCHQLRHSRAMHLLQSGVNLIWIRDLLGHTSIQTTEVYARADSKQKREAIERASECLTPSIPNGEWVDNRNLITWLKEFGKR
ncbi:integrase [Pedobacter ginsengisoli]|uniref:Integrase n=1 Tax=Pedobacter ginsengisoli TaxID=363852 RepID=A0A2D1U6D8_9SPHI|nr:tyrosine-type recombinase/integrase [Pedobacter ginsengisoli]ATP57163.1 integrase [Pedobacter ginsengisoli]